MTSTPTGSSGQPASVVTMRVAPRTSAVATTRGIRQPGAGCRAGPATRPPWQRRLGWPARPRRAGRPRTQRPSRPPRPRVGTVPPGSPRRPRPEAVPRGTASREPLPAGRGRAAVGLPEPDGRALVPGLLIAGELEEEHLEMRKSYGPHLALDGLDLSVPLGGWPSADYRASPRYAPEGGWSIMLGIYSWRRLRGDPARRTGKTKCTIAWWCAYSPRAAVMARPIGPRRLSRPGRYPRSWLRRSRNGRAENGNARPVDNRRRLVDVAARPGYGRRDRAARRCRADADGGPEGGVGRRGE